MRRGIARVVLGSLLAVLLAGVAAAGDKNTLNVGFYIEPTSPFRAIKLLRLPGWGGELGRSSNGAPS